MNKFRFNDKVKIVANTYEADPHTFQTGVEGKIYMVPSPTCFCDDRYIVAVEIESELYTNSLQACAEADLELIQPQ